MAVRLALHLQGLPAIPFENIRMVASYYLGIPSLAVARIVRLLAEIELAIITTERNTIKTVLPNVPYYEDLYSQLGGYAVTDKGFNEAEELTLDIIQRLARSPDNVDALRGALGADARLFDRALHIGQQGDFLVRRRARGRDILLSPTYFSENVELFADIVAGTGATAVTTVMEALRSVQGIPLGVVEKTGRIGNIELAPNEIQILRRMAQDGAVRPPSIATAHSGANYFLFTPTPSGAALPPTKRDIYERAMAIVAAVRQGEYLPNRYRIRSPAAVIGALRSRKRLGRATTEATEQYRKLVHLRIGRLVDAGHGYAEFHIIDTQENMEALDIAYDLVADGDLHGMEVDAQARSALQMEQTYLESLLARAELQKRPVIELPPEDKDQYDLWLTGGGF